MFTITIYREDDIQNTTIIHDPNSDIRVFGKIQEEIGAVPSFTFSIYPNNPGYELLFPLLTHVVVTDNGGDELFNGRLLKFELSMNGDGLFEKEAICEGSLAYLCDSVQPYKKYNLISYTDYLTDVLSVHNDQVPGKTIQLGNVDIVNVEYISMKTPTSKYLNTFETLKSAFDIQDTELEISVRHSNGIYYLDVFEPSSHQTFHRAFDQKIEIAKNLININYSANAINFITHLMPLGRKVNDDTDERVTINERSIPEIDGDYAVYGKYVYDLTTAETYGHISGAYIFEDIALDATLVEKAKAYLAKNNRIRKTYQISAVDLAYISNVTKFKLGYDYQLNNPIMGINNEWVRIIKKTTDINEPYNSSITIGDKLVSLSSQI